MPEVLKGLHDSPFCGHLGVTRTEAGRVRERFYWPRIRDSLTEYVKQCLICQQRKSTSNANKAPMQTIEEGEPFTFWAIDYMGPIAETVRGNKHILKWSTRLPQIPNTLLPGRDDEARLRPARLRQVVRPPVRYGLILLVTYIKQ